MKKPLLIDLYCGAGLASIGYHLAGFEVIGVDICPQPRYPFRFFQADALEFLDTRGDLIDQATFLHASPPCQAFSCATAKFRAAGKKYADLVDATRSRLQRTATPYCIENVLGAPVRRDIVLRGTMFGLHVIRPRAFELGEWFAMQPAAPRKTGSVASGDYVSVFGKAGYRKYTALPVGWRPKFDQGTIAATWAYAMGIPEQFGPFRDIEIAQGIPPAYSRWIGEQFLRQLPYSSASACFQKTARISTRYRSGA